MPLTNILEVELFDVCVIYFIGPFSSYLSNQYILVSIHDESKWSEAMATQTNNTRVVVKFFKKKILIFFKVMSSRVICRQ